MGKLKKIVVSALIVGMLCACTGCGLFDSEVNELHQKNCETATAHRDVAG